METAKDVKKIQKIHKLKKFNNNIYLQQENILGYTMQSEIKFYKMSKNSKNSKFQIIQFINGKCC